MRVGSGWNTAPVVFQTILTKPTSGQDNMFVDVTSANILVAPGTDFVIEMQGLDTGTNMLGSYVDPASGPPLYPEPLFLNGPGCFAGCGWRIGFMSYVTNSTALGRAGCSLSDPPCVQFAVALERGTMNSRHAAAGASTPW